MAWVGLAADAIDSYSKLRKTAKGTGNEVHHIVEKRFIGNHAELGKASQMDSIILSKSEHAYFTQRWRTLLPYGKNMICLKS